MGLYYNLNCLVILFIAHVFLHCFAFDLMGKKIRRPQYSEWIRAETDLNDHKNGNHFSSKLKANTKMQTTATPPLRDRYVSLVSRYVSVSTTPSYIEFDYLDENHDKEQYASLKRFVTEKGGIKLDSYETRRPVIFSPSFESHNQFNDPYIRQELVTTQKPAISKNRLKSLLYPYFQPANNFKIEKVRKLKSKLSVSDLVANMPFLDLKAVTVKVYSKDNRDLTTKGNKSKLLLQFTTPTTLSPTLNDRVRFFEMYDINTLKPMIRIKLNESGDMHSFTDIVSEKMSQISDHNCDELRLCNKTIKTKVEQKHNYKKRSFHKGCIPAVSNQIQENKVLTTINSSIANITFQAHNIFSESEVITKTAVDCWSNYPFASVYVYKPTQTYCDAAGISPHWLLAAGSCLSRYALVHSLHDRSAYVTYCGDHWRRPERIAYVKRSVVHPKFHPRDNVRRLLFNIGLIQVAGSMAASCPRWSPVALMSHHFSSPPGGSVASAVGWGLDSKAKLQNGDGASNVYCLLLPPYGREVSDPVHGGLLLIEGKLVALYLQEERRPRGPQSAQYTGVWRLLPWVMDIAREPDDADLTFDV